MYIKVRTMDGTQTAVLTISKLTSVADVRLLIEDKFDIHPDRQRLFFRGKQMEDGHTMFDYNVNINDVIQLLIKPVQQELVNTSLETSNPETKEEAETVKSHDSDKENAENNSGNHSGEDSKPHASKYYKVGDLVDAQSQHDGAWWEATIMKIAPNANTKKTSVADDGLLYYVKYARYEDLPDDELKLEHIRPRAKTKISHSKIKPGIIVMVNYNFENPEERGFWYDCKVTRVINTRAKKTVIGTIYVTNKKPIEECHIHLIEEVFKIEKHLPLIQKNGLNDDTSQDPERPVGRESGPACNVCKDHPKRKCKECGCHECGGKENPNQLLLCDECDQPFHIYCLDPPLEAIPDVDEWFCPLCKNDETEIVRAGEKLKASKKKASMASAKNNKHRDWGKGFACAGRQKICDIVPQNHFGPIPGVEVGSLWKFRLQASEAGIHRPHVAGIHGRENEGAYSIVLAGGYEDDEDRGDEFTYTGSGGRDLSGNKRTAEQSCDQTLTRMNKALALNCNARLNNSGAEAADWTKGKPVRVVRSYKGKKHSEYSPEEGVRYDGIYKIVKYWQDKGKSGFKVWRYLLRRDDPNPAPWTKEGKKKSQQLGLTLQYPDGYLEAEKAKEDEKSFIVTSSDDETDKSKKRGRKRKSVTDKDNATNTRSSKKSKTALYMVEKEVIEFIDNDCANKKLWDECLASTDDGKQKFLSVVEDRFLCVCCQSLVVKPVITPCSHNICHACLQRSFKAEVYMCPACRHDLGKDYEMKMNENLQNALQYLFPGYEKGR